MAAKEVHTCAAAARQRSPLIYGGSLGLLKQAERWFTVQWVGHDNDGAQVQELRCIASFQSA